MESIKLVIKTTNYRIPDLVVDCLASWNILQLKEHLSNVFPTKPNKSHLRIIYAGRLLQDSVDLSDVFQKTDEIHTIHLVCPLESPFKTKFLPDPSVSCVQEQLSTGIAGNDSFNNLVKDMTSQEFQKCCQEYYSYVYNQYIIYLNSAVQEKFGTESSKLDLNNRSDVPPVDQNLIQNVQQAPDPQRFVQIAAAGGALDEFEEGMNRDLLDWVYYLFKIIMFSAIVYYYSSATNALISIAIFGFLYLVQQGWFRFRQIGHAVNVPAPVNVNENRPITDPIIAIDDVAQPSIIFRIFLALKLIGGFIFAFFASLIPEQPAPLNLN